ncbi:MAG TPA: DUF6088 family protein [Candidatus Omnitrophota bacterium]|nr:DUF6088 family protein [Candidatus Omnitrophota bacterium]
MAAKIQTVSKKIMRRIYSHKRGWVFVPIDFVDFEGRKPALKALAKLTSQGKIRRITKGFYYYPRFHHFLGEVPPDYEQIAKAIARKNGLRIQRTGAYAANILGLSDQVPAQIVFLTDGSSRTVSIGNQRITFKKTATLYMVTAGRISGLVIQALRYLGKDSVDHVTINKLKRCLSQKDKKQLFRDISLAPAWISEVIRKIAQ